MGKSVAKNKTPEPAPPPKEEVDDKPPTPRYMKPKAELNRKDDFTGIQSPPDNWWATLFVYQGTVLSEIIWRLLLIASINAVLVALPMFLGIEFPRISVIPHTLLSLPLGLLLVFRTNSAYDRFWEGRKAWGSIITVARYLARYAGTISLRMRTGDMFPHVFVAFTLALKHRLRGSVNTEEELADLSGALLPATLDLVMRVNNRPGACLRLMNEYFQDKNTSAELSESLLVTIQGHIAELNMLQYSCERIINTPIPLPYQIQIRQLVFLYCITLPLVLVGQFPGIYSLIATSMLSFGLMGIEEAGKIIQNPFGDDDSDLPLESFIELLESDLTQTIAFSRLSLKLANLRQATRDEPFFVAPNGKFKAEKLVEIQLDDTMDLDAADGRDIIGVHGLRAKGPGTEATYSAESEMQLKRDIAAQEQAGLKSDALRDAGRTDDLKEFGRSRKPTFKKL